MGDRRRRAGSAETSQDLQLWSQVRAKLASLTEVQDTTEELLATISDLQAQYIRLGGVLPYSDDEEDGGNESSTSNPGEQRKRRGVVKKEQKDEDDDLADDDDTDDEKREIEQKLMDAYERLRNDAEQEQSIASETLEALGILIALRTPDQLQVADGNKRKKRRLDGASPGLSESGGPLSARNSPAPSPLPIQPAITSTPHTSTRGGTPTPASTTGVAGGSHSLARSGSQRTASALGGSSHTAASSPALSLSSSTNGPGGVPREMSVDTGAGGPDTPTARTPGSGGQQTPRVLSKKEKRDILAAQLPLREGRPVAFRPPPSKSPTASSGKEGFAPPGKAGKNGSGQASMDSGSTDWIQARVVRCIQGDKNRYEVEDVDDAADGDGAGARYNTTLKAILVLPDPRDKATYPPFPYSVGSQVIALYPDTTSFYKARVVAGPGAGKAPKYKLTFEDDEGAVRAVSIDHVVDLP